MMLAQLTILQLAEWLEELRELRKQNSSNETECLCCLPPMKDAEENPFSEWLESNPDACRENAGKHVALHFKQGILFSSNAANEVYRFCVGRPDIAEILIIQIPID